MMDKRLYVKTQSRAHGHDILAIETLQDCRLARIVQAPSKVSKTLRKTDPSQEKNSHSSLFLSILPDDR